jgi:hypothetical protein
MSCSRKIRTYISRAVLVSGKKSFMHEQDFYEIGLLPIGGLTDEVLVKCSAVNYHTTWVDVNTLISIPPAIQARNGLTITSGFVELGGILIQDTAIDAAGFNLDITGITTFTTSGISLDVDFSSDITITGGAVILDSVLNNMSLITPLVTGGTANIGDVLTLQSAAGVVEWAPNAAIPPQARNGLSVNGNFVEMGGPLLSSTAVTVGATSDLTIISTVTPNNYFFIDDSAVDLSSVTSRISLSSELKIQTPSWYTGPNTYTTVGKVLQNVNVITAEAEFSAFALPLTVGVLGQVLTSDGAGVVNWATPTTPPLIPSRYVQTFVVADWVTASIILGAGAFDITILAATHGRGVTPIVQVQHSGLGVPGPLETIVTTDQTGGVVGGSSFGAISINASGDIILTTLPAYGGGINGKVIIM